MFMQTILASSNLHWNYCILKLLYSAMWLSSRKCVNKLSVSVMYFPAPYAPMSMSLKVFEYNLLKSNL